MSNLKKKKIFTWCLKRDADITFLQETRLAIMIKNNLDCTIHHTVLDPMGRYIIPKADIGDSTYLLR